MVFKACSKIVITLTKSLEFTPWEQFMKWVSINNPEITLNFCTFDSIWVPSQLIHVEVMAKHHLTSSN